MKEGWEIKKLGEVAEYFNGLTYSPKDVSDKGTIVLRSSNIQNDELEFSDIVRVSKNIKEKLYVKEGDILMCSRNGSKRLVGKTAPIFNLNEPMTFGTFMMIIRSELGPYLLWFFKTEEFKKQISGGENTMINQVTRYMLDEIKIPLPTLSEQQRIVSILAKAFTVIDKAKVNAEQNLQNAKELFESYLQGAFECKGDGWVECNLEDNIKLIDYRGRTPQKTESGVRLITAKNVKLGFLQLEPQEFIAKDNYESWMTRGIPNVCDVIFTTEAPLANVAQIESDEKLAFAQRIIVMQPNRKKLNPTFLKYMLLSGPIRKRILEKGTGATVVGIKSSLLKKISIYFPNTVEEQQTIVRQLDALRAETQKLEALYQKKMDDLEELKKSVLQKAFAGELKTEKALAI